MSVRCVLFVRQPKALWVASPGRVEVYDQSNSFKMLKMLPCTKDITVLTLHHSGAIILGGTTEGGLCAWTARQLCPQPDYASRITARVDSVLDTPQATLTGHENGSLVVWRGGVAEDDWRHAHQSSITSLVAEHPHVWSLCVPDAEIKVWDVGPGITPPRCLGTLVLGSGNDRPPQHGTLFTTPVDTPRYIGCVTDVSVQLHSRHSRALVARFDLAAGCCGWTVQRQFLLSGCSMVGMEDPGRHALNQSLMDTLGRVDRLQTQLDGATLSVQHLEKERDRQETILEATRTALQRSELECQRIANKTPTPPPPGSPQPDITALESALEFVHKENQRLQQQLARCEGKVGSLRILLSNEQAEKVKAHAALIEMQQQVSSGVRDNERHCKELTRRNVALEQLLSTATHEVELLRVSARRRTHADDAQAACQREMVTLNQEVQALREVIQGDFASTTRQPLITTLWSLWAPVDKASSTLAPFVTHLTQQADLGSLNGVDLTSLADLTRLSSQMEALKGRMRHVLGTCLSDREKSQFGIPASQFPTGPAGLTPNKRPTKTRRSSSTGPPLAAHGPRRRSSVDVGPMHQNTTTHKRGASPIGYKHLTNALRTPSPRPRRHSYHSDHRNL